MIAAFHRIARRRSATLAVLATILVAGGARAQTADAPKTTPPPASVRVGLAPSYAELGQQVLYRGSIIGQLGSTVRWLAPEPDDRFTWGAMTVRTRKGAKTREPVPPEGRYPITDTVFVEIPLQVFQTGRQSIPGLRFELDDGSGPTVYRLPMTTLSVVPIIAANDTSADFRGVHGPLAAPWWERVPWTWVIAGVLLLAAIVALVLLWRRRRRRPAAVPAPEPVALDPLAEALAALAALRQLHLPEHGRFAEHAFRLGQILRRYLEAVTRVTRPGDTTPELVRHLQQAGLDPEDQTRLSGLLRVWDRVKFAREPFTADDALRAETAVETFLRRPPVAAQRVA
jgi:hypothetical protein